MKRILLAMGLFSSLAFDASAQGYSVNISTGTYTDLVNPTVGTTAGWDDGDFKIPIGFSFTVADAVNASNNLTVDSVSVDYYGDLYFTSSTSQNAKIVTAYEADLVDRGTATSTLSPISYQLSGSAGSRILKIEYKNVGFFGSTGAIAGEFANFQIWLYEGSNKIEMRYGTSNVNNGLSTFISGTGSSHGIAATIDPTTLNASGPFLSGAAASPTSANTTVPINTTVGFWVWPSLTGVAPNGAVYAFTPAGTTGLSETLNQARIEMFPNPTAGQLKINGLQAEKGPITIRVYDVLGKVVLSQATTAAAAENLNLEQLQKGTYFVEISAGNSRAGKQIIKL